MTDLRNQLEAALGRIADPIPDTPTVDLGTGDIPIVEAGQGTEEDPLVEMLTQAVQQPDGWYADDGGGTPTDAPPPSTPAPTGNSLNAGVEGDEQLTAWLNNRLNS